MNDLIKNPHRTIEDIQRYYPDFFADFMKAKQVFDSIRSFEDIEVNLLKGQGLAAGTYRTYMTPIRQLYEFTSGLNPFQIRASHIEAFYDQMREKVDRNSLYNKIQGLKRFFKGIQTLAPGWRSPFEVMPERLAKKLNRSKKTKTKKALTTKEVRDLLAWLESRRDLSILDALRYATAYQLVTSGLRAAELCSLRWKNLEYLEGKWTAYFTGKGDVPAEQELYTGAVQASRYYFKMQFHRDPHPDDYLFYTEPTKGRQVMPLDPHALWYRIKQLGKEAEAQGIIKRHLNWSPHLFRRSYATALYKSGMKLKAIMEKTRHSNIEVLAKHYISDEEPAAPYFDRVFRGA